MHQREQCNKATELGVNGPCPALLGNLQAKVPFSCSVTDPQILAWEGNLPMSPRGGGMSLEYMRTDASLSLQMLRCGDGRLAVVVGCACASSCNNEILATLTSLADAGAGILDVVAKRPADIFKASLVCLCCSLLDGLSSDSVSLMKCVYSPSPSNPREEVMEFDP